MELPPAADINAWMEVAGRQLVPRFPPAVEQIYASESRARRMRAIKLCTLTGWMSGIVFAMLSWPLLTDIHPVILHVWVGLAIPLGMACSLVQRLERVPLAVQEWQSAACALTVSGLLFYMLTRSALTPSGFLVGGAVMLMLLDGTAARMSFAPAAFLISGLAVNFACGIWFVHGAERPTLSAITVMIGLVASCGFYALYGNWLMETEMRRSYALALRERIERRVLTRRNKELGQMLGNDPLTGLANRRAFDEKLAVAWAAAAEAGRGVSLITVDVDFFKAYNDTYGHPAGDACLRSVANCLRAQSKFAPDVVARLGGEEFGIVLFGAESAAAQHVAELLRLSVQSMVMPHSGSVLGYVTVSVGVATMAPRHGADSAVLLEAADQALYGAKRGGRNKVCAAVGLRLMDAA